MSLEIVKAVTEAKEQAVKLIDEMYQKILALQIENQNLKLQVENQGLKKPQRKLCCPHCSSEKIISTDNEALEHNRVDDVDTELYVSLKCTNCDHEFKEVFTLTL